MPHLLIGLARLTLWCLLALSLSLPGTAQNLYSSSELDTLVGPVALYPDPLLTNVVKASTFPDQVAQAAKTSSVNDSWDDSVKAVHAYSDVMSLMGANPQWTQSLGWAATHQLSDLMDAVQRYRYRAQQAGNLESGDQVVVVQEGTTIRIEPANPQVIYVPTYNPADVDDDNFGEGFFFGAAVATSAYLWTNIFSWNNCAFYAHPYGWFPPAGYYRPYGWRNTGVYNTGAVRVGNTNIVRGGVNVNNVTFNNRIRNGATRINTGNSVRVNANNTRVTGNNVGSVNRNNVNGGNKVSAPRNQGQSPLTGNRDFTRANNGNLTRPEAPTRVGRPPVSAPSASAPRVNRAERQPRSSSPSIGSYTSSGQTVRQSNRGAQSRGSRSVSSGARYSGGGRAGGGGGRRR